MTDVALRFKAIEDGLDARFSKVNKDLDTLKRNSEKASNAIGETFSNLKAIGAATAILGAVKSIVSFADATLKVNIQTGISIAKVQELSFMAGQADVAFESLTSGIARMQRALVSAEEGQKASAEALQQLGIDTTKFFNLKPDEQFREVAIAVSEIEDPATRTDRVMDLLGRGGQELIPILLELGRNSSELENRFQAVGGPVADEVILKLDDVGDAASSAGLAAKSLGAELLSIGAPTITAGLNAVTLTLASFRHAVAGGNNELVNISDRILELQAFIEKPTGFFTFKGYQEAIRKARNEIEELQARYDALTNSFVPTGPALFLPDLDTSGLRFEETDEQKKAREQERLDFRNQRQQNIVNEMNWEIQKQLEHDLKLKELNEQAISEELERDRQKVIKKLEIQTEAEELLSDIREVFNIRQIELEEIKNQSIFGLASGLFMDLARENTKFAKLQQGIALAQTIYSTAAGIMKAFQTLPWPASIIAAGKVALAGAIQVAKIKATNYSSGGGSAPSVAGGSVSSASERAAPVEVSPSDTRGGSTIYISGFITKDVVGQMVDAIRGEFNRDVLIIPTNSLQAQVLRSPA